MNDVALAQMRARLQRVERQNRILFALLCAFVGIASLGATKRGSNVAGAQEIRAHRFSLVDPTGAVVDTWYSEKPGTWHGP